jgi:cytochrome c553
MKATPILALTLFFVAAPAVVLAGGDTAAATAAPGAAAPPSVQTCVACHGADGNAGVGGAPNIGGQKRDYLYRALMAFKSGERVNPLMQFEELTPETLAAAADYYAVQAPAARSVAFDDEAAGRGQHIAANCIACHGMRGVTVNSEWPNLAGQHPDYLVAQLAAYRSGMRQHRLMNVMAKQLTDRQIWFVANYYASLPGAGEGQMQGSE